MCEYRVWGRGGNFLSKLETKCVTAFSLSPGSNPQGAGKAVILSPLSDGKKEEQPKMGTLREEGWEESNAFVSVCVVVRSLCC